MRIINEEFQLDLFLQVARTHSFAKAGESIGLSRASISRQMTALEKRLGVTLFVRDTNGVSLTPQAIELLPHVRELLDKLHAVSEPQNTNPSGLHGTVQISAPSTIGYSFLIAWLASFQEKNPEVLIDLSLTLGPVRVMSPECDIRISHQLFPAARVISRPLGSMLRMMVASPAYLAKHGKPEHPEELAHHSLLGGNDLLNGTPLVLIRGNERAVVSYLPKLKLKDHTSAIVAALADAGIAVHAFKHNTMDYVLSKKLIPVLPDWQPLPSPVSMLLPSSRTLSPAAESLADYIEMKWRSHPYLTTYDANPGSL